jgi:hypothetical protein
VILLVDSSSVTDLMINVISTISGWVTFQIPGNDSRVPCYLLVRLNHHESVLGDTGSLANSTMP